LTHSKQRQILLCNTSKTGTNSSSNMGSHDDYGKQVLACATDGACEFYGAGVEIDYGAGLPARIDGAIHGSIAVEVESRTSKQIRGAVLDLIFHPYPKKLLILLPVHMSNPQTAAAQCRFAMSRFVQQQDYEVIVLAGHGDNPQLAVDTELVRSAIRKLAGNAA